MRGLRRAAGEALTLLWTIWCAVAFGAVALVLFPFLPLALWSGSERLIRAAHRVPHYAARIIFFLWGVRVVIHGTDKLRRDQQYVFAGNHRSDLDAILASYIMPGYYKYIGKAEVLSWPVLGYLLRHFYISVDRSDPESRRQSMHDMLDQALKGASIIVFPEGWSNFSDEYLLPFKRGAFQLAIESQLPLAVFTIVGAHEVWPKPRVRVRPGVVHVFWEAVIPTAGMTMERDDADLQDQVRDLMLRRLRTHYPDGVAAGEAWERRRAFREWKSGQIERMRERSVTSEESSDSPGRSGPD